MTSRRSVSNRSNGGVIRVWEGVAILAGGIAVAAIVGIYKMDERLVAVETTQHAVIHDLEKLEVLFSRYFDPPDYYRVPVRPAQP